MTEEKLRILKLHKRWADRYTLIWLVFAVVLLTGFQFVLDQAGIEAVDRTAVMLLLALIVIVVAIWQAAGLAVARVHMIIRGIDLEQ
jgi:cation transport ATPase